MEKVTLTIDSWRNDDLKLWQDKIIPAFEAANPGIKVKFEPTAPAEYNGVLSTRLEGGTAGDLITCRPFDASLELFDQGHLASLNDLPGMANFGDVAKSAWITDDGSDVFCVPMASVIHGFIYNKTAFDELGLSEPTTEDEFYALLDAVAAGCLVTCEPGAEGGDGDLVGTQATLAAQGAGDAVLALDPEDPAIHARTVTAAAPTSPPAARRAADGELARSRQVASLAASSRSAWRAPGGSSRPGTARSTACRSRLAAPGRRPAAVGGQQRADRQGAARPGRRGEASCPGTDATLAVEVDRHAVLFQIIHRRPKVGDRQTVAEARFPIVAGAEVAAFAHEPYFRKV